MFQHHQDETCPSKPTNYQVTASNTDNPKFESPIPTDTLHYIFTAMSTKQDIRPCRQTEQPWCLGKWFLDVWCSSHSYQPTEKDGSKIVSCWFNFSIQTRNSSNSSDSLIILLQVLIYPWCKGLDYDTSKHYNLPYNTVVPPKFNWQNFAQFLQILTLTL